MTTKTDEIPAPALVPAPAQTPARVPVRAGIAGLVPTTIDEMWRLAQYASAAEIVPKDFRNKPHNTLIAMEHGLECGVPWMQAIQNTAVINGRPGFYGDLFLAVIMMHPDYVKHDEHYLVKGDRREYLTAADWKDDETAAICTFWRRGKDTPTTRRFSVGQAKKANLLGKAGPWTEYPDRQLSMRARAFAGRDSFPDALKGMSRPAEELRDLPPEDPAFAETPRPVADVRRMSETPAADLHAFGIDRTDATRGAGASMPPTTVPVGPLAVVDVQPFLGGFTIRLADGTVLDATEAADAAELEKVKGSGHAFLFRCERRDDGNLQLQSFAIAD